MRKLTSTIVVLMLMSLSLFGQIKDSIKVVQEYNFFISGDNNKPVAYQKKDSAFVVLDSAATIKSLIYTLMDMQEQNKKNYREIEKGYAAMEILRYVHKEGSIIDIVRFREAVRRFMEMQENTIVQ